MRLRTVVAVLLVAPAAIAAGTLAVFLGAGLLIAITGHAHAHAHAQPRVAAAALAGRPSSTGMPSTTITAPRRIAP
jgi:hypothetical protein